MFNMLKYMLGQLVCGNCFTVFILGLFYFLIQIECFPLNYLTVFVCFSHIMYMALIKVNGKKIIQNIFYFPFSPFFVDVKWQMGLPRCDLYNHSQFT